MKFFKLKFIFSVEKHFEDGFFDFGLIYRWRRRFKLEATAVSVLRYTRMPILVIWDWDFVVCDSKSIINQRTLTFYQLYWPCSGVG